MKEKLKRIYEFLKKPNILFTCISYILFAIFTTLAFVCLGLNSSEVLLSIMYSGMGITFFYCVYLFVRYDYRRIKQGINNLKEKLSKKSKFLNKVFNDSYFRTIFATIFSFILGIGFVGYNAFAGIYYQSIWNGTISVYYAFLVCFRIIFLSSEFSINKNIDLTDQQKDLKRAKMFKLEGILLICVNIALLVPVTLLAMSKKDVDLPMQVAIANACFTFYKMIVCVYGFVKSRKNDNLAVKGIKNLNLTSGLVSLLTLENTMIITFSESVEYSMKMLIIISAFVVVLFNFWIAIATFLKGRKQTKALKIAEQL